MKTHLLGALALLSLLGCSSDPAPTNDAGVTDVPRTDVVAQDTVTPTDVVTPADVRDAATADAADPCNGLIALCHDVDPGSGPLHDCHEGAHDGDATWCAANAAMCRTLCIAAAADGGAHDHDAAATDAAHDHDAAATDAAHDHDAGGATDAVAADAHVH